MKSMIITFNEHDLVDSVIYDALACTRKHTTDNRARIIKYAVFNFIVTQALNAEENGKKFDMNLYKDRVYLDLDNEEEAL